MDYFLFCSILILGHFQHFRRKSGSKPKMVNNLQSHEVILGTTIFACIWVMCLFCIKTVETIPVSEIEPYAINTRLFLTLPALGGICQTIKVITVFYWLNMFRPNLVILPKIYMCNFYYRFWKNFFMTSYPDDVIFQAPKSRKTINVLYTRL